MGKTNKSSRLNREFEEMVQSLNEQLGILEDCAEKAFVKGQSEYCAEVATKLRLLVVQSHHNKPLLLEISEKVGIPLELTLDGPPIKREPGEPGPGDTISLDRFFDLEAVCTRTTEGLVTLSKRDLIRAWCEQLGGAQHD